MRKNYFMKNVLVASMLLAVSLGMSSCSGFIDAVIGTSDQPTTQPTTQPTVASAVVTADQTTITISSFDDMAKAISAEQNEAFVKAIEAKAAAGEEYTINIKSEKPLSTEDFEGFAIPRVEEAAINLVFDQPLVTSEESPLKITADEKNSDTPTTAVNELTITLPDGSDKVYLSVDMPETSVTLAGNVTYEYVEATTAINTLYVPSDAIIKEFYIKGGRVIVQNGGIIETYVYPASDGFIRISSDGVIPYRIAGVDNQGNEDWDNPVYQIADEQGNPYYIQNLKIVKGEAEYATIVHEIDKNKPFKKLIIADGAAVNYKNGEDIRIETIEGHGNARFLYGVSYESGNVPGEMVYTGNCDLRYVKNLSGVAFSPLWGDKLKPWDIQIHNIPVNTQKCSFEATSIVGISDIKDCDLTGGLEEINGNFENCTIVAPNDGFAISIRESLSKASITFSNCKISIYPDEPIKIEAPKQSAAIPSFTVTFEKCDFTEPTRIEGSFARTTSVLDANGNVVYEDLYCYRYFQDDKWWSTCTSDFKSIPEDIRNQGETTSDVVYGDNPKGYTKSTQIKKEKIDFESYNNYILRIAFDNCTMSGSALTYEKVLMRHFPYIEKNTQCYYNVNGVDYVVDTQNGGGEKGNNLKPANASTRAFGVRW